MDAKKLEAVRRAKDNFARLIPAELEVVGVGIGLSGADPALKVNLRTPPKDEAQLPHVIDGVPVIYDVIGKISSR